MPDAKITYKKPETLKVLKSLAKYFDFKVEVAKSKNFLINGVTIVPADKDVDPIDLSDLFTERNIDATVLREKAWNRNK